MKTNEERKAAMKRSLTDTQEDEHARFFHAMREELVSSHTYEEFRMNMLGRLVARK